MSSEDMMNLYLWKDCGWREASGQRCWLHMHSSDVTISSGSSQQTDAIHSTSQKEAKCQEMPGAFTNSSKG